MPFALSPGKQVSKISWGWMQLVFPQHCLLPLLPSPWFFGLTLVRLNGCICYLKYQKKHSWKKPATRLIWAQSEKQVNPVNKKFLFCEYPRQKHEMMSEEQVQKFDHTDDVSLPSFGYCFWLLKQISNHAVTITAQVKGVTPHQCGQISVLITQTSGLSLRFQVAG